MGIRLITGASYVAVLAVFYLLKIYVSDLCFDALIWLFSLIGTFEMLRAFGALGNKNKLKDGSEPAAETFPAPTKAQAAGVMAFAAACVPACALFQQFYGSGARAAGVTFLVLAFYLVSLLVVRHAETGISNTGAAFFAAAYPTALLVLLSLKDLKNTRSIPTSPSFAFSSSRRSPIPSRTCSADS